MMSVESEVRGGELLAARQCIESQFDAIRDQLVAQLRNQKSGQSLSFSLLSDDQNFAPFAPAVRNTQTEEEMSSAFLCVLQAQPLFSPENIQNIFSDSNKWNQLVEKTMLPIWSLVAQGNRYARAFANCISLLGYFIDGVEMKYSEKPIITFQHNMTVLTLSPDLVTLLRFNLDSRWNMDEVKGALYNRNDAKLPLPKAFSHTFREEDKEFARASFRRYLFLRHTHSKLPLPTDAQILKRCGFMPQAEIQQRQLGTRFGLPIERPTVQVVGKKK